MKAKKNRRITEKAYFLGGPASWHILSVRPSCNRFHIPESLPGIMAERDPNVLFDGNDILSRFGYTSYEYRRTKHFHKGLPAFLLVGVSWGQNLIFPEVRVEWADD